MYKFYFLVLAVFLIRGTKQNNSKMLIYQIGFVSLWFLIEFCSLGTIKLKYVRKYHFSSLVKLILNHILVFAAFSNTEDSF